MTTQTSTSPKRTFYYGWVIVLITALAGFCQAAGFFPVLSVLLKPVTKDFGWTLTTFTFASTVGTLAGGVVALFVGRRIDWWGGRWLLTGAFFVLGLTFIGMAYVQALWQFYILQVLGRIVTMGMIPLALQIVVPKWFVTRRSLAVSLASLGGVLGNAMVPLTIQWMVQLANWRVASLVTGVGVWAISLLPIALFMRRQPEDMGLLPDGAKAEAINEVGTGTRKAKQEISFTLSEVTRFPSFYLLGAAFTLLSIVGPAVTLNLVPYLEEQGLSAGQAVWVLAVWSAAGAIGSLLAGAVSAKVGPRRTLSTAFMLMALGVALLLLVHSWPMGLAWAVYMGSLIGGIFNTLYQVIFADYFGRESLGRISGLVWPPQMVANAVGPLVAAVAYDAIGNYTAVFIFFAALVFICGVLAFFAKPPRRVTAPTVPQTVT